MKRPRGTCMICGQNVPLRKDGAVYAHFPKGGGLYCAATAKTLPLERWLEMMETVQYKRPEKE